MNIYLDIETIPLPLDRREFLKPQQGEIKLGNLKDPEKIAAKVLEAEKDFAEGKKAALDSLQAQIVLIGYAVDDGPVKHLEGEESDILKAFWQAVAPRGWDVEANIIAHNMRFDGNMLVHRSWLNGVIPPANLIADLTRYDPRHWKDTMVHWNLGDRHAKNRKLKHLCAAFKIACKESPVSGEDFYKWWSENKEEAKQYNRQDVEAVRHLWLFMNPERSWQPDNKNDEQQKEEQV
jgi:hypothetical protein